MQPYPALRTCTQHYGGGLTVCLNSLQICTVGFKDPRKAMKTMLPFSDMYNLMYNMILNTVHTKALSAHCGY